MIWRIEIKDKKGLFDSAGESVRKDILELGITSVKEVNVVQVYLLEGDISSSEIEKIASQLLVDQITQEYQIINSSDPYPQDSSSKSHRRVEIAYHAGVMDPVEESTLKGIRDLGINGVCSVRTARAYTIKGPLNSRELDTVVNKILSNKLIQQVVDGSPLRRKKAKFVAAGKNPKIDRKIVGQHFQLNIIDLIKAKDRQLKEISLQGQLFLNLAEMKAIQNHFKRIGRNPTDCELETIAQTWSEHCYHKTFRGQIRFQSRENGKVKTTLIKNLLKSTIVKATQTLNRPWCVSVFHDNAGVIAFDEETNITFKVETHNHPCALEPFGGANTGVGGVIRDSLGTGLGAKPICNTDIFCFACPDLPFSQLPAGTLHPRRIMKGVVSGVRDYGNKMGIPTVNGAIVFDDRFVGNPLVFCGNVGIIPKDKVTKKVHQGDLIVLVGGRTGRDGIHGATFSSGELTGESEVISSGAVQIGNPIEEKKVLDGLLQARDRGLYRAITDCGAGGLSSAVGEMAQDLGCRVDLEKVPLKYQGLQYAEIWISESQERMVLAVPPNNIDELLAVFQREDVEATVLGEFTDTHRLELFFLGCQVCDLDMEFLHQGIPLITKTAVWKPPQLKTPRVMESADLTAKLAKVLSHGNVCSKESVIRQYDHEVQGSSVIKPLVGIYTDGPSDASVLRPRLDTHKGIALANGINVRFGQIDPFWMAASCIDEAIRQIVAVGGDPRRIAILDNFCWGNPDKPDRLGSLVRAAQGCLKAALELGSPFISGKDSLYNEFTLGKKSIAIPGTLLISAIGIIDDVRRCVTMDFKAEGNIIYIVGETKAELGGSIYLETFEQLGQEVPQVNFKQAVKIFTAVHSAMEKGWIKSAHDCSEGGLGVALAEMAFSGGLGAQIDLSKVPYKSRERRNDWILFSESNSRFLVEVSENKQKEFEAAGGDIPLAAIGRITKNPECELRGLSGEVCVKARLSDLKEAWQRPLRW